MKSLKYILAALIMASSFAIAETDYRAMREIKKMKAGTSATPATILRATDQVKTDTVNEYTDGAGVTTDGVLQKDGGSAGAGDAQYKDVTATNEVVTDVIAERTAGTGVTVDGLLIKDGDVLQAVAPGSILVGNASTVLTEVVVSGDATMAADGTITFSTAGDGAVVAAVASVAETRAEVKSTVITLTNCVLTATDGSDEGESQKAYDFSDGAFNLLGVVANCSIVSSAGVTGTVMYVSCGSAAAGDDNDLTGTEADIIPRTTIDASGAGITTNDFDAILATSAIFDGTATAKDCYVNFAIDDDNMDADVTNTFSGTITLIYTKPVDN